MKSISREKAAAALKQEELGVPLEDIIRELGISREAYLSWRRGYRGAAGNAAPPAAGQLPDRSIDIPGGKKDE